MFTTFFDGRRIGLINRGHGISIGDRIGIDFFDVGKFRFYAYPTVTDLSEAHCGGAVLTCSSEMIGPAFFDGRDLHISHVYSLDGITAVSNVKTIPDICERGE